ncbi:Mor transcription activator family protein [Methylocaldum sp. MU1018]
MALSVDVRKAVEIAATVEARLTHKPAEAPLTPEARNARIRAEWNGRNVRELMKRHGVSRSTVYRVVGK